MGHNLKKVPAKIPVLVSQWVSSSSGCEIMTLNVGSGEPPVYLVSIEIILPPFHSSLKHVRAGETAIALTEGQVITPGDTYYIALFPSHPFRSQLISPEVNLSAIIGLRQGWDEIRKQMISFRDI